MVEDAISFWTDIQRYENMLAADPNSYCFTPLSELYRKLGLVDDAIAVAQKGCALHPDYPAGFLVLGAAYLDKGMKGEARRAFEQVLVLEPGHRQALKLLGQLCVETGEIDLARKALGELVSLDPEDTESALLLRSIGAPARPAPPAPPEEEIYEDADVIEDLTEVMDEGQEPQRPGKAGLAEVAQALADFDWVGTPAADEREQRVQPAAPEREPRAGEFEALEDLWAIEAPEDAEDAESFRAFEEEEAPVWGAPKEAARPAQQPSRDPLTTATLAELYVSQGFVEKAAAVYRELLTTEPGNEGYRARYGELQALKEQGGALTQKTPPEPGPSASLAQPAPQPVAIEGERELGASEGDRQLRSHSPVEGDLEAQLTGWLENIRRRRDGV